MPRRARLNAPGTLHVLEWFGENEKVSIEKLRGGSRRKEVSRVRKRIAIGRVKEHGVALAEVARRLGVSTSAISKIIKRTPY